METYRDELMHYGVPGMKWGVRKQRSLVGLDSRRVGAGSRAKNNYLVRKSAATNRADRLAAKARYKKDLATIKTTRSTGTKEFPTKTKGLSGRLQRRLNDSRRGSAATLAASSKYLSAKSAYLKNKTAANKKKMRAAKKERNKQILADAMFYPENKGQYMRLREQGASRTAAALRTSLGILDKD